MKDILLLIVNTYILKVFLEIILTPVTYKVVGFIKQKENIDTFDNELKYKIF